MPAEAEIVFDVMADVDRMADWLPTTLDVQDTGPNRVGVAGEADGRRYEGEGLFRAQADQLRIEWGSSGPDYAGWAQVYHGGVGTSEVNLHLSFLGDQPQTHGGEAAERTRQEMREALERLERIVARRVNDAS